MRRLTTRSFPNSVHGVVLIHTGKESDIWWGTGIMIGPNIVLTAAHNLYDNQKPRRKQYPKIQFIPGVNENEAPFGTIDVDSDKIYVTESYVSYQSDPIDGAYPDDFGVLILRESIGEKTGYFGLKIADMMLLKTRELQLVGYLGDKVRSKQGMYELWGAIGMFVAFDQQGMISHQISTYSGQSGSGIFYQEGPNQFYVIGVHVTGTEDLNIAVGITKERFDQIMKWRDCSLNSVGHAMEKFFPSSSRVTVKDIKLIVVGSTGAGKSTLINFFYLWSQKIPVEKLSEVKSVLIKTRYFDGDGTVERNLHDETKSCTSESRAYRCTVENSDGAIYNLQFLDTPGLGDVAGIQQDDKNIEDICEAVAKTEHLNAILLIINGTEARVHARLKYLVKRLEGMIPDRLHSCLFVLLTNVDMKPNMNPEDLFKAFGIEKTQVFQYNNQIFKFSPEELKDKEIVENLEHSFNKCKSTLSKLFDMVSKCQIKKTEDFLKIKEGRYRLKMKLQACNDKEKSIQDKKQELYQIADALQLQAQLYKMEEKQLSVYQREIDELHNIIHQTVLEMRTFCSKFDYVQEVEAIIIVLEEQIEICYAEMNDDPKKERELVSYRAVKNNMVNLLAGIQKHIGLSRSFDNHYVNTSWRNR